MSFGVIGLTIILLVLGAIVFAKQTQTASRTITDASRAETIRFLTDLVKIDTSNPPGNEVKRSEERRVGKEC
jgi:hypothetical protein